MCVHHAAFWPGVTARLILLPIFFSFLSRSLLASSLEYPPPTPAAALQELLALPVALSPQLSLLAALRVLAEREEEDEGDEDVAATAAAAAATPPRT